jgi:dihydroxyacid dehydratase/phosphogluconate dehydratase
MNWTEEDLGKPRVLVDSAYGMGHPGTFHFRELIEEVSNGVYEAGGKPGVFTVSDICDGVVQAAPSTSPNGWATSRMSRSSGKRSSGPAATRSAATAGSRFSTATWLRPAR